MHLDQHPFFRKIIVPWYDSEKSCAVVIGFMVLVIVFGLFGISVGYETAEFKEYIWVPVLLVIMSAGVAVSTAVRLFKRHSRRP